MRVTHVITTLEAGGAEAALYRLASATHGSGAVHAVVTLTEHQGAHGERLRAQGIAVSSLGMRLGVPDPRAVPRLVRMLRRERPDLVQGWMYKPNLLASIAAVPLGIPVIWGIRHAAVEPGQLKRTTRATNALCAALSGIVPARIVCCAQAALESHARIGYRRDRMMVIPNGFEVERFARDPLARARVRAELAIPATSLVVGTVGRDHPDKGIDVLVEAARVVTGRRPDVTFVVVGPGLEWSNSTLAGQIDRLGLRARFRLLGRSSDVPALLSAMDVLASPSRTEAFSQVIGEAMSAGLPCVVTDCGDSREIVGTTGRVVPVLDPVALATAILELVALSPDGRAALGAAASRRVAALYDLRDVTQRWLALYSELSGASTCATAAGSRS